MSHPPVTWSSAEIDAMVAAARSMRRLHGHRTRNSSVPDPDSRTPGSVMSWLLAVADPIASATKMIKTDSCLRNLLRLPGCPADTRLLDVVQLREDDLPLRRESFLAACRFACIHYDIGLALQFADDDVECVHASKNNAWLTAHHGSWVSTPPHNVPAETFRPRVAKSTAGLNMPRLRSTAIALGLPKPHPRSKEALARMIENSAAAPQSPK